MRISAYLTNALLAGPPKPCAWCLKEMNLKPQPGSHGICKRHRMQVEAEFLRWQNIHAVEDATALPHKAMGKERKDA